METNVLHEFFINYLSLAFFKKSFNVTIESKSKSGEALDIFGDEQQIAKLAKQSAMKKEREREKTRASGFGTARVFQHADR